MPDSARSDARHTPDPASRDARLTEWPEAVPAPFPAGEVTVYGQRAIEGIVIAPNGYGVDGLYVVEGKTTRLANLASDLRWYVEQGIRWHVEQGLPLTEARAVVFDLARGMER